MIDVTAMMIATVAGFTATGTWHWLTSGRFRMIGNLDRRVDRLESESLKAKKKSAKVPSAGPFRTAPIGDPNVSPLPEPTPPVMAQVVSHDDNLTCPVCNACNRFLKKEKDGFRPVNKSTHTACSGCAAYALPHLHVECWACKFKYAVKAASESEDDEA